MNVKKIYVLNCIKKLFPDENITITTTKDSLIDQLIYTINVTNHKQQFLLSCYWVKYIRDKNTTYKKMSESLNIDSLSLEINPSINEIIFVAFYINIYCAYKYDERKNNHILRIKYLSFNTHEYAKIYVHPKNATIITPNFNLVGDIIKQLIRRLFKYEILVLATGTLTDKYKEEVLDTVNKILKKKIKK